MEFASYFRFILALVFVLGLIGLLAWLARRFGMMPKARRGGSKRLSIVEVAAVDAKRRLVLVRRDEVEHLIMLSATSDLVIESGIPVRATKSTEAVAVSAISGGGQA